MDAEGSFVFADVREAGKNSNGCVFHSLSFGRMFNYQHPNLLMPRTLDMNKSTKFPHVFVGDEAYALHKHMMKPFAKTYLTREPRYTTIDIPEEVELLNVLSVWWQNSVCLN